MINKQDYSNYFTQDIDMVKGDTLSFDFLLQNTNYGSPSQIDPKIVFACADESDILFTASRDTAEGIYDGITIVGHDDRTNTTTYNVRIAPDKTKNLDLARYYYDLEATIGSDVFTLMRGRLTLLREIAP